MSVEKVLEKHMNSLPSFSKALTELIATASISSTHESWNQGDLAVIQLLGIWLEDLGLILIFKKYLVLTTSLICWQRLAQGRGPFALRA